MPTESSGPVTAEVSGAILSDLGTAAKWYAHNDFPVFPLHCARSGQCSCSDLACENPGKHPRTRHGFKNATTQLEQIEKWWREWPDANIGIATGARSGLLVIDVDPRNGGEDSLEGLIAEHGRFPDTAEQMTGGGGRHIVFRNPGVAVPKTLAPGIDVKADGGYIVVAPSVHASGRTYEWDGINGANALLTPAEVPSWLLECIAKAQNGMRQRIDANSEKWTPGQRNQKLTSLAGTMRRRGMSPAAIEAALLEENQHRCDPLLSGEEVRRIAKSVGSYTPADDVKGKRPSRSTSTTFRLTDDAVLYIDPDPEKETFKICGRLEVVALTRDARGDGWGRLLKWRDAEGRIHEWAMPMPLLAGDGSEYRARLLDGGLVICPGRKVRDLLTTYIQSTYVEAKTLCVSHVGWQEDYFVLPGVSIGPKGSEIPILQTVHESEHLLQVAGSLEEWIENVGRFCSGNSRLLFTVSCALAGPLLSLVGAESGGVHLVGVSSTGKSTALQVGGSVLGGGGRNGFVQSCRTTANGLEATADLHNDLTLFLDELAQMDAREAVDFAYLLANGSGKARMSRSLGSRKKITWKLMFVSAGETTLAHHAQTAGRRVRAGAEVRLLNIEADAGVNMGVFENLHGVASPDEFARQLQRAALRFYGAPLRSWLEVLTMKRAAVEKAIKNFQRDFLQKHVPVGASGEIFRAAQRFALIAAAGELASDAAITGWQSGEATNASVRCLQSWIGGRGTTGAGDTEAAINQLRRFLEANGASRFQVIRNPSRAGDEDNPDEAQIVRERVGFRRRNPDDNETEYLILREAFRSEVCAGHDYRWVLKAVEERGYLVREHPHWTIKPGQLPELPRGTRVYCIRARILGNAE